MSLNFICLYHFINVKIKDLKENTLGAETFANFANFAQIRKSLRREKFYIDQSAKVYACKIFQFFLFFSKHLAALDNALILVSWRKKEPTSV